MLSKRVILTISAVMVCVALVAQAQLPNVALNGTGTSSSTGYGWVVTRGNDGDLNSGTHTADGDADRWYELELDADYDLTEIVIHNRASCCWERLENAVLKVLDADRNEIYVGDPVAGAEATQGSVHAYGNGGAGFSNVRYIRVEGGTTYLTLMEVEAFALIPYASGPGPSDGSLVEAMWVNLSWRPGDFAVSHDVYLGESFEDVDNGTADTFRGNQAGSFMVVGFVGFAYPDGLVPGATYYWRVDAVDEANPKSRWSASGRRELYSGQPRIREDLLLACG